VTIITDRVTLDEQGTAVLDGGGRGPTQFKAVILIEGVQGVVIKGFTIRNSPGEGILGLRGAAFDVQQSTVQDNPGSGIVVGDHSSANLTDCIMRRNSLGLDVFNASSVILKGTITANDNTVFGGINVFGQSVMEIRGAAVQVNNNGQDGLVVGGSQLVIFLFAESQPSKLIANGNGRSGIIVVTAPSNYILLSCRRWGRDNHGLKQWNRGNSSLRRTPRQSFRHSSIGFREQQNRYELWPGIRRDDRRGSVGKEQYYGRTCSRCGRQLDHNLNPAEPIGHPRQCGP
jgi:hypothetical protein